MRALLVSIALISTSLPALAFTGPGCKASLSQFEGVKLQSVSAQAYNLIGCKGTVISETSVSGTKVRIEQWDGTEPYSLMHITFSNGYIKSKSQFGLK